MKRTKKNQNLRGWLLTLALVFGIFLCSSEAALAAGTAKVVASSGKIRAAASKKDGSGYTWYKVYINDEDTGYIRADLVTVEGTISEEKESSSTSSSTSTTSESGGNKTVVGSNNSTETEKKDRCDPREDCPLLLYLCSFYIPSFCSFIKL